MKKASLMILFVVMGCASWIQTGGLYTSRTHNFSVELPQGWMRSNTSEYMLITRDGVILQNIAIKRRAIDEEFEHTKRKLSKGILPQEAAGVIIDNINSDQEVLNFKVIENIPVEINESPSFKVVYTYKNKDGLRSKRIYYGVVDGEWFYSISYAAALRHYFEKDLKSFEELFKSFKLINSFRSVNIQSKPAMGTPPVNIHNKPELDKTHTKASSVNLRSTYNKRLSVSELQELSHITIRSSEKWGFHGHSIIQHDYKTKIINGEKVVIDHATNLMWHQSGSNDNMKFKGVKKWIKNLNSRGYAGYNDWRLPTVEEAVTLLESSKKNGDLYIDTVFDKKQSVVRTGDSKGMAGALCWFIRLNDGAVRWKTIGSCDYYIRPVRIMK